MLRRYNRSRVALALLAVVFCGIATTLTWGFFYFGGRQILLTFWPKLCPAIFPWLAAGLTALVFVLGFIQSLRGREAEGYEDFALRPTFEPRSGGSLYLHSELSKVAGPTYLVSQIILAAPRQAWKAWRHLKSRISEEPHLEERLVDLLARVAVANRWQPLADYPGEEREVFYLIRMEKVDFSPRSGKLKIA